MKKCGLLILVLIFAFFGCKNNQKKILDFNDEIIVEQEAVINSERTLVNSLNDRLIPQIDSSYQQLLSQIVNSEIKVTQMVDPDPEIGFKQATLKLFSAYKIQTQHGYKTLVELSKVPDSLFTPRQAKQFEEISSSIFVNLNAEVNTFMEVQNKLAEKYKFTFNQ